MAFLSVSHIHNRTPNLVQLNEKQNDIMLKKKKVKNEHFTLNSPGLLIGLLRLK